MNAGAYNKEMKDVLKEALVIRKDGSVGVYENKDLRYEYRKSVFQNEAPALIIEARLELEIGDKHEIKELLDKRKERRLSTQPLEYPSGGSTFKNPKETSAYLLIDKAGLRGYMIGGAKISEKHCNFVINWKNATGKDIKNLVEYTIKSVSEKTGIILKPEIEFFNWDFYENSR